MSGLLLRSPLPMNEIFRHLRPTWFDKRRCEIHPETNGGLSFYLRPDGEPQCYNYWLYICPLDYPFSAKSAVRALRHRANTGVVPWGRVELNASPLTDQLINAVMSNNGLKSAAGLLAFEIMQKIIAAESARCTHLAITPRHALYVTDAI